MVEPGFAFWLAWLRGTRSLHPAEQGYLPPVTPGFLAPGPLHTLSPLAEVSSLYLCTSALTHPPMAASSGSGIRHQTLSSGLPLHFTCSRHIFLSYESYLYRIFTTSSSVKRGTLSHISLNMPDAYFELSKHLLNEWMGKMLVIMVEPNQCLPLQIHWGTPDLSVTQGREPRDSSSKQTAVGSAARQAIGGREAGHYKSRMPV